MGEIMNKEELSRYVGKLFKGKVDKGGFPYVSHCARVAKNSNCFELGLLHDVMEDCGVTRKDLLVLGLSEELVNALEVITKKENENYDDYINRIISFAKETKNIDILSVKKADLLDNMDITRLPVELTQADFERLKKYRKAYDKIFEAECIMIGKVLSEFKNFN